MKLLGFLTVAALCCADALGADTIVDLSDFLDKNLEFLHRHGTDSYYMDIQEILFSTAQMVTEVEYSGVSLASSTGLKRSGPAVEDVGQDTLKFSASFSVDKLIYDIKSFNSTTKMGPDNQIVDSEIAANGMAVKIEADLIETDSKTCRLAMNITIDLTGDAFLLSPYPFYNQMNVTKFFKDTYISGMNDLLAQAFTQDTIPHVCDPVEVPKTVFTRITTRRDKH